MSLCYDDEKCVTDMPVAPVIQELQILEERTELLTRTLQELYAKLEPISVDNLRAEQCESDNVPMPPRCNIENRIIQVHTSLNVSIEYIQHMIQQLRI